MDFNKIKIFPVEEFVKRTKKQITDWGKIFANRISDKGLES